MIDKSLTQLVRIASIRKQLDAPTHKPLVRPNTAAYHQTSSGHLVRERYCLTCRTWDVTGNHARYGHRTCK